MFDANIFHYAAELKAALDRVRAGRPVYLVLSHSHADHADGTMFFSPPAQTLASDFTRRRLAWWVGQDQTSRNAEYVDHYPAATNWYRNFRMVVPESSITHAEMIDLGAVQFVSGWALTLLLALPVWWIWRRRRQRPAIVFSRTGVLAGGPRAGRVITLALFVLRNLLLAAAVVALARFDGAVLPLARSTRRGRPRARIGRRGAATDASRKL